MTLPKLIYRIDLGHIISLAILLITGAAAYGKLSADSDYLKMQVAQLAPMRERLVRVETRLEVLLARPEK